MARATIKIANGDRNFRENMAELFRGRACVEFATVVVDGKAIHTDYPPHPHPGGFLEFNGWRYELDRVSSVAYYLK